MFSFSSFTNCFSLLTFSPPVILLCNSDSVGNKGAYINVTPDAEKTFKLDYVQFEAVEHPKTQPYSNRFRGGFWSEVVKILVILALIVLTRYLVYLALNVPTSSSTFTFTSRSNLSFVAVPFLPSVSSLDAWSAFIASAPKTIVSAANRTWAAWSSWKEKKKKRRMRDRLQIA